ncbi:unnamed protein product [Didymodactylos carnosus]|uniref:SOCS box domain-containing protein n=1 Tax=Didymodactylos carnosus TaxID=1234261 RepID=A0A813PTD7_9BILA|nr:unnamed protein product [Didymodactylos carnosus]CAF3539261.1 unnamed protein product [Didymodactylos carnosus]
MTQTETRPRLCRSSYQSNILEYIDTCPQTKSLNELFSSKLSLSSLDQFNNTILDQYLVYILCLKIIEDNDDKNLFQLIHQLLLKHGQISKSIFEYTPPLPSLTSNTLYTMYQSIYNTYSMFIYNEFDLDVLIEIGCFLLKYRLCDIFTISTTNKQTTLRTKYIGFFIEIIAFYYIYSNHNEFYTNNRPNEQMFQRKNLLTSIDQTSQITTLSILNSRQSQSHNDLFEKFLNILYQNGEIQFDLRQIKNLLQMEAYQFINKKLENKKVGFIQFIETIDKKYGQNMKPSTLKSLCRYRIKMCLKQFPIDIRQLNMSISENLQKYLSYDNKYIFESYA